MKYSPVLLFVYNRLIHTQQTIEALKKNKLARDSELFIFSDAPKTEQDNQTVKEVRKYIKQITGFKRIKIIKRDKNYGLSKNIISGVTDIINKYNRVIVIEDDLIASHFFLKYMNDALELYKDEKRVMQISGYMFPVELKNEKYDAIFLPLTTCWGWGMWKRAWDFFDPDMKGFHLLNKNKSLRSKFNLYGAYDYFNLLKLQRIGKVDSWAIRCYLSVFLENGLVLFPKKSLIYNNGFDGSGVHCQHMIYDQKEIITFSVNRYPLKIKESSNKYIIFKSIRGRSRKIKKIKAKLYEFFKKII